MAGAGAAKQNTIVILVMSAVLIAGLISAVMIPAGEFPPSGYALFEIGLDALMTILLAVLVLQTAAGRRQACAVPRCCWGRWACWRGWRSW